MDLELKDTHKKDQIQKERRKFLKKATYSAPKLMMMGYLLGSSQGKSDDCDPFTGENCYPPSGPINSTFIDKKILKKINHDESEIV